MNKKLERYRQLRDKKKARLEKAQKDMDRLEQMVQDEENTQIVAAVRSGKQIVDYACAGADIVTCGLQVYKDSFEHPFTSYGLGVFRDAWDSTVKE